MAAPNRNQVHFELFVRKTVTSGWSLQLASEDREQIVQEAQDLIARKTVAAVRVSKEAFDPSTGEFQSMILLTHGAMEQKKKSLDGPHNDTVCNVPQDLYTPMARERISRLLDDWLHRHGVTAFELLHRPDLIEKLDAAGSEIQHAIQKISIPESQETGMPLHDVIRRWTGLIDKAVLRVIQDGRKKVFPELKPETFLKTCDDLETHDERVYVLSGGIAQYLSGAKRPMAKLDLLFGLIRQTLKNPETKPWVKATLESAMLEQFSVKGVFRDVLGENSDTGDVLSVLVRLLAENQGDCKDVNPLPTSLMGYRFLVEKRIFKHLNTILTKQLLAELKGPKRLRPASAEAELALFGALNRIMFGQGGDETEQNAIQDAFVERSKNLVAADFVEALLKSAQTSSDEVDRLIELCGAVLGSSNKRQAARWLVSVLGTVKFERELRENVRPAGQRLSQLAAWQWKVIALGLPDKESEDINAKFGQTGAQIAQDVNLIAHMIKVSPDPLKRLSVMLSLATGQNAPFGPVSEQAKAEVMKILRNPEVRQSLAQQPQMVATLKPLLRQAGLAA